MIETPRNKIRNFINGRLPNHRDFLVGDTESLFLSGRLSSLDGVELLMFLEANFGLDLGSLNFDQAQIDTVEKILELVDH